jgi:hypothetical protein
MPVVIIVVHSAPAPAARIGHEQGHHERLVIAEAVVELLPTAAAVEVAARAGRVLVLALDRDAIDEAGRLGLAGRASTGRDDQQLAELVAVVPVER